MNRAKLEAHLLYLLTEPTMTRPALLELAGRLRSSLGGIRHSEAVGLFARHGLAQATATNRLQDLVKAGWLSKHGGYDHSTRQDTRWYQLAEWPTG